METKYNSFYAHLEIHQSEEINSDLDNLQSVFNQRAYQGQYDIYCLSDHEKQNNRLNPRFSEIPTVYLVTCRKTEHLPEFQFWTKENNLSEDKSKNIENSGKIKLNKREQESEWKSFAYSSENFKIPQQSTQILNQQSRQHRQNGLLFKNRIKIFGSSTQQIQWKTDFIILKGQKCQDKTENEKKRNLFNFCQRKQRAENYIYSDKNVSNDTLKLYRKIMNIVEQNQEAHKSKMEEERSEKSFISRSSHKSLSIKSGNMRMINQRMFQINKDVKKRQETQNYKNKANAKRKRTEDFEEQWKSRKYCQDVSFCVLKQETSKKQTEERISLAKRWDKWNE